MTKHRDGLGVLVRRLVEKQAEWKLTAEEVGVLCRALVLRDTCGALTAKQYVEGLPSIQHGAKMLTGLISRGYLSCSEPLSAECLVSCDPLYATLCKPDGVEVSEEKYSLSTLVRATMHLVKPSATGETKMTERHWKRISEFSQKREEDYIGNDLELLLAVCWVGKGWISQPPSFTVKDYSNAKRMVAQYGPESAAQIIIYAVTRWESVAQKIRVNSYPSMSIIYGFRNSISPLVLDGEAAIKPSWGSQFNPETDSRSDGGIVGW
jgi:hypothetical protein